MDAELRIRPARLDDADAISALILSLARFFLADPEDPAAAADFLRSLEPPALAANIGGGDFHYHVALLEGELVGAVGVRGDSHLYHLFVAEHLHRRGIAARLWEAARAAAAARGHRGRFTVNSSLYAIPLYRRLGFAPVGEPRRQDGIAWQPMELAGPGA